MLMNSYILVIKLYQPLLNSHSKCKLQKLYDLCDHAISNSILWISLAKSIIMNVSLFISVSYSNSFDKYTLKYYKSYVPCVFVSDKVAQECCAQRRVNCKSLRAWLEDWTENPKNFTKISIESWIKCYIFCVYLPDFDIARKGI